MEYEKFNPGAWHALCLFLISAQGKLDEKYDRVYRDDVVEIRRGNFYRDTGIEVIRVHTEKTVLLFGDQVYSRCILMDPEFDFVKGHIAAVARQLLGTWPPPG